MMNLAHRGASEYAPENTLAAFYKGLEMGASGLETDLRLSRDGIVFLLHDERLERTTNGTGRASEYTWKELQELDAGSWFAAAYAGERLVSLETFLHFFARKPIHLALEMKEEGLEEDTLRLLAKYGISNRVTITSFQQGILRMVRRLDSAVRIGFLVKQYTEEILAELKEISAQQICLTAETITKDGVNRLKAAGLEVRAWRVRDEALMHHCLECGVDGMTINFPDKLTEALRRVL
ncbi:glycerophosphodiester phosphodiesterase [Paenibacillus hamazuiensis]|uniref:glycerophosphodiester phosphodiesterase n=1 Tax=Paenibacillus hamazuiensis TaxID=2936508 RepID=UPI00200DCFFB|nr:glycerophosphodiester phosphodiesterase family protein [Paenibacillus hamazuiensis]